MVVAEALDRGTELRVGRVLDLLAGSSVSSPISVASKPATTQAAVCESPRNSRS